MTSECLYIIDTFSLMFQVFHAIPPMTGPQGQPTNAVFGFTRDLLAIRDRQPSHLVCAFDSPGDGHRNGIYPAYKANRREIPEDLQPQIPLLKELLAGFRVPAVEFPAWEADDVIATITRQAVERSMEVVIVTSDKDARQLLGPKVRLFNCRRNTFLDPAGLLEDWGVRPDQVVDYQSLVGDAVDNVPGVPKVGPRTARTLMEQFGTLDNVLANADKAPGKKLAENLVLFADQARLSRELVRLNANLPLNFSLDEARVREPDYRALLELFTRLGFRRYASDMRAALATREVSSCDPSADAAAFVRERRPDTRQTAVVIQSAADVADFITGVNDSPALLLAATFSGSGVRDRQLTSMAVQTMSASGCRRYLLTARPDDGAVWTKVLAAVASFPGELVVESAKPLCHALLNAGLPLPRRLFDVSIADYLLDAGARSHDLPDSAERHAPEALAALSDPAQASGTSRGRTQRMMFAEEPDDSELASRRFAAAERNLTLLEALHPGLSRGLAGARLSHLYHDLEEPLIRVLARMEHKGICVDAAELMRQSRAAADVVDRLTSEIYDIAGHPFNIDSPKQLATVLFAELNLPIIKKTQTGASTDQEVLEELAALHPLPARILERRHLIKLKGTYLDALPQLIHPDTGRIHSQFHQTVAATGRLSSSDPNLQNIPIRTPEGRQVRKAFRAGTEGWQLMCADYSQIELRVLAHFSGDDALREAFRHGIDIHSAVASEVYGVPVGQVTADQRRVAKAVNFGVIYGQSPWGLAAALGISQDEAGKFINDYFARYSGVAEFCKAVLTETAKTGYARTILNRRRAITGIRNVTGTNRNMAERTAINTVIQGSAADLVKQAMLKVDAALAASSIDAALLLQIHDELVFECPAADVPALADLVRDSMQSAMTLDVPLEVDITTGPNWFEQREL